MKIMIAEINLELEERRFGGKVCKMSRASSSWPRQRRSTVGQKNN